MRGRGVDMTANDERGRNTRRYDCGVRSTANTIDQKSFLKRLKRFLGVKQSEIDDIHDHKRLGGMSISL